MCGGGGGIHVLVNPNNTGPASGADPGFRVGKGAGSQKDKNDFIKSEDARIFFANKIPNTRFLGI